MSSDLDQAPEPAALERLAAFLESDSCPPDALTLYGVDGLLFALACSPDPAPPTQWMATVFGGQHPEFADEAQAEDLTRTLLRLSSAITQRVKAGTYELPAGCEPRSPAVENLKPDAPLQQWSKGFDLGHARTSALWDQLVPKEHAEELGMGLLALTFWADTEAIAELRERSAKASELSVPELAERLAAILPTAVSGYAGIGRSIANALERRRGPAKPEPARREKVGRNEPCPCGSGRKFKQCCGP
ncbi:UPF0149 family protein [Ectothiorhodospiraceae bacterium WFHF3C12]|nr:UPF0149 family protein [Ectothiorhodospiraceae bacterium WFHF3C12]